MKLYEIDNNAAIYFVKMHIDRYDSNLSPIENLDSYAKRTGDIGFILNILFKMKENNLITNASYLANKNYFSNLSKKS